MVDPWPAALHACRELAAVPDAALPTLLLRILAEHGRRGAELALRSVALAEAKGWLDKDALTCQPATPVAHAVRHAARGRQLPRASSPRTVRHLPTAMWSHTLRHLSCRGVAAAAVSCRDLAAAARAPSAFGAVDLGIDLVRRHAHGRGPWWFRGRRPVRLRVASAGVGTVLARLWTDVHHLRVDAVGERATLGLPPQRRLHVLLWPRLSSVATLTRTVVTPALLRRVRMERLVLNTAAHGEWWSRAVHLEELHVRTVDTQSAGLDAFAGFPHLQALHTDSDWSARTPTAVAGVQAVVVRSTRRLRRVDVRCPLHGDVRDLPPHSAGVDILGLHWPLSAATVALTRSFRAVNSLLMVRVGDGEDGTSLATLCVAAAGRVAKHLLLQGVGAAAAATPCSPADLAVLRAHEGSMARVLLETDPGWSWREVRNAAPCLALGRQVGVVLNHAADRAGVFATLRVALPQLQFKLDTEGCESGAVHAFGQRTAL